jgi:predicted DNA-binding transcriptional regulator YafY
MSDPIKTDRWEVLVRYRFIETIALWEGRLTTRHLVETFGIGRQQASKDINNYKRSIAPDNLVYDKFVKGYTPSAGFIPRVTRGDAEEYLQLLARQNELAQTFSDLPHTFQNAHALYPPARRVTPQVLRPLLQAARETRRVEVDYVSLNNPDREGRIIVPHTLVWTGQRWHVRGWCEKNRDYRDFVLSRFRGEPDLLDASPHTAQEDRAWATTVTAIFAPHPGLSPAQQQVVAHDHQMPEGKLAVTTRACLLPYLLEQWQVRPAETGDNPLASHIILANKDELAVWLRWF